MTFKSTAHYKNMSSTAEQNNVEFENTEVTPSSSNAQQNKTVFDRQKKWRHKSTAEQDNFEFDRTTNNLEFGRRAEQRSSSTEEQNNVETVRPQTLQRQMWPQNIKKTLKIHRKKKKNVAPNCRA